MNTQKISVVTFVGSTYYLDIMPITPAYLLFSDPIFLSYVIDHFVLSVFVVLGIPVKTIPSLIV